MDIFMDALKVVGRIITILPLLLGVALYMGRRSIGELPVFDFLVVLVLGSVVGADIADPKINHIHTVVAIIAIALLQKIIVQIKMKKRRLGKLLTFEPVVVIYNGQFMIQNLQKINYAIDNILQMLREKEIFHVMDVEIAIVEPNGSLSVRMVPEKETVKREDLSIVKPGHNFEVPIILDGMVQIDIIKKLNKDEAWLMDKLIKENIDDVSKVFYGAVDSYENLHISLKESMPANVPPIEH